MKYCIANWKMNLNILQSIEFIDELKKNNLQMSKTKIILCPSFTSLSKVKEKLIDTQFDIGAQDVNQNIKGSFTGEISANMLQEIECEWVILGHSERRKYYLEEDIIINDKLSTSIKSGLNPILCIGEDINQRNTNETFSILEHQLTIALNNIDIENSNMLIAYEPVWAIGTGVSASVEIISETLNWIKEFLMQKFSKNIPILYGGSVCSASSREMVKINNLAGFLIGTSSLEINEFIGIFNNLNER